MKTVTRAQMQALDHQAIEEYGIPALLLMENAGRGTADQFCFQAEQARYDPKHLLFLCGRGNNGGDGLVTARHLASRGYGVEVLLFGDPSKMSEEVRINYDIVQKMKLPLHRIPENASEEAVKPYFSKADVIVDALFGIGLDRPVTGLFFDVIVALNFARKKVLSLDIPSGLDADTGQVLGAAVRATWTAAMGFPKKGFLVPEGAKYVGELWVIDIGLPKKLLESPHS